MTTETQNLPSGLPDAEWLVKERLLKADANSQPFMDAYGPIVPAALGMLTGWTSIQFSATPLPNFTLERIAVPGYRQSALTRWYPVTTLTTVRLGTTLLKIGSNFYDVSIGNSDVAIDYEGGSVSPGFTGGTGLRWRRGGIIDTAAPIDIFVDYTAGLTQLPSDLLEVFVELCQLMHRETSRIGLKDSKVSAGQAAFLRDLPPWAKTVITKYTRMGVYV